MKAKFILLLILIGAFSLAKAQVGQLPNDTFQNWTVSQYAPDSWCTLSSIVNIDLGLSYKDTNSADSYFGETSVGLVTDSIAVAPQEGLVGGILSLGTGVLPNSAAPTFSGIPFPYRPDTVYAIYLYSTPGADFPTANILMTAMLPDTTIDTTVTGGQDSIITISSTSVTARQVTSIDTLVIVLNDTTINGADTTVNPVSTTVFDTVTTMVYDTTFTFRDSLITTAIDTNISSTASVFQDTIMYAGTALPAPVSSTTFVLGVFPITGLYLDTPNPDTLLLQFSSSLPTIVGMVSDSSGDTTIMVDTVLQMPVKGSNLILSQVFLGYVTLPTGLQKIADKMNFSLYPNPTNNVINISSADNAEGFKAVITDMAGRLVYGGVLNGSTTSISVQTFASGMYICRIVDQSGNVLKQDKFIVTK